MLNITHRHTSDALIIFLFVFFPLSTYFAQEDRQLEQNSQQETRGKLEGSVETGVFKPTTSR